MPNMCRYERDGEKSPGKHLHFWDTVPMLEWWDVRTGRVVRTASAQELPTSLSLFAASPDGRFVAGRGSDKGLRVWDAAKGTLLWSTTVEELYAIEWGANGATLVGRSRDGIRLWDSADGQQKRTTAGVCSGFGDAWALRSDGLRLACGASEGTLSLSKTETGEREWLAAPPAHNVDSVTLGGDRFLASGTWHPRPVQLPGARYSTRNAMQVFDLAAGQLLRTSGGQTFSLAFAPDARRLLQGYTIQDAASGTVQVRLMDNLDVNPSSVSFSADGSVVVGASALNDSDFSRDRWDPRYASRNDPVVTLTRSRDQKLRAWDTRTGKLLLHAPEGTLPMGGEVLAAAITPDGSLALGAFGDEVGVYDLTTRSLLRSLPGPQDRYAVRRATAMAASPDNHTLAVSHGSMLRLWNARTGVLERSIDASQRGDAGTRIDHVMALAFSPDGSRLAAAMKDATVRSWDVKTAMAPALMRGHAGPVTDVAYTSGGGGLVSGGDDGTIRFWDASSGEPRGVLFSQPSTGEWAVATPEGLFDGTQRGIRDLVGWRFADNSTAPLEMFFGEFYSPGLLAAVARGEKLPAPRDIGALDRRQPRVTLAAPRGAATGTTRLVGLTLEVSEAPADRDAASGSGARDVRVFRNGSLVKVWRGDVLGGKPSVTLTAEVPIVAGGNRLTAYAFNRDNIKSADAELGVTGAAGLARRGTAWILAIGINRYANADYDLSFAVPDAREFAEALAAQQKKLGVFGDVVVVTLADAEATKQNILAALGRLAGGAATGTAPSLARLKPAQPEDAVFVFYAGHGTAAGPRFYLIPHDLGYAGRRTALDAAGLERILAHGVSDRELELAFETVDAGRLLLVIDACNSGQALEAEEKRRGPMNSQGLAQLAYEKGMYVLTASQGYQAALEASQLGHGLLTYALVEEGLKAVKADAEPKDGRVVLREWLDYATRRVPDLQGEAMREAQSAGRALVFVEGEQARADVDARSLQRPRVFYRREPEAEPLVVAASVR
jgi:WD40 repeat protein